MVKITLHLVEWEVIMACLLSSSGSTNLCYSANTGKQHMFQISTGLKHPAIYFPTL